MNTDKIKGWEERFDRKFLNNRDTLTRWGKKVKNRLLKKNLKEKEIKSFLSEEIAKERGRLAEKLKDYFILRKPQGDRKVVKIWIEFDKDTETTTKKAYTTNIEDFEVLKFLEGETK